MNKFERLIQNLRDAKQGCQLPQSVLDELLALVEDAGRQRPNNPFPFIIHETDAQRAEFEKLSERFGPGKAVFDAPTVASERLEKIPERYAEPKRRKKAE